MEIKHNISQHLRDEIHGYCYLVGTNGFMSLNSLVRQISSDIFDALGPHRFFYYKTTVLILEELGYK
jgi:hypothetical protein